MSDTTDGFAAVNFVRKMERKERFAEIMKDADASEDESREIGLKLVISNNGHHWRFYRSERLFAEWWPSKGSFVLGQNYSRKQHVESWLQLRDHLTQAVQIAAFSETMKEQETRVDHTEECPFDA